MSLTSVGRAPDLPVIAADVAPVVTVNGVPLDEHITVGPARTVQYPPGETTIPADVRVLLAELELLSHGSTQNVRPAPGGQGAEGRVFPPGESRPPHVELRARYVACRSDRGRREVIAAMGAALKEARGLDVDRSRVVEETADELAARIVKTGEGLRVAEAALIFRCTPSMVRRARLAGECEAEFGKPLAPVRVDPQERADRAEVLRLRSVGLSVRAIALSTGVARSTVQDWIAGEAA